MSNNFISTARRFSRFVPSWVKSAVKYCLFLRDYRKFEQLEKGKSRFPALAWRERYPCLDDNQSNTPFDKHYIYHPAWAARVIAETRPDKHVDVSSSLSFSTILSAFVDVEFLDYRPALLNLSGMVSKFGDLMSLPFGDGVVPSISCMHVVEHIGLGRYGDPMDFDGDIKAIAELQRVVKPGGDLLLVVPVGKSKIAFNAHRVYSYEQIVSRFGGFSLQEFSLITDFGHPEGMINHAAPGLVSQQEYGCGCFWFKKLPS